jgi:hypothetical protein
VEKLDKIEDFFLLLGWKLARESSDALGEVHTASLDKLGGDVAGLLLAVIGLCRFEPGELDPYLPGLRVPGDAHLTALPSR